MEEVKATAVGGGFALNSDLADTLKSRTASEEDFVMGSPDERMPLEQVIELEGGQAAI